MELSIIVVNWNTQELLYDCLTSLEQACGEIQWECIVVDNHSTDNSVMMVENDFPKIKLINAGSNCGFSRGNNLAFPEATGDYILLLNPDTVCLPGSLKILVDFAKSRREVGVVGPLLVSKSGAPTITYGFFPRILFHWLGFIDPGCHISAFGLDKRVVHIPKRSEKSHKVDYVAGACFLMPRDAMNRVGQLDESFFMYFEETDWCKRALEMGLDTWYCAESEVMHLEGQAAGTVSDFSITQFQKSYRIYLKKHHGPLKVMQLRIAQFAEYSLKGTLRALSPRNRITNNALSKSYFKRAKLQLRSNIELTPP